MGTAPIGGASLTNCGGDGMMLGRRGAAAAGGVGGARGARERVKAKEVSGSD